MSAPGQRRSRRLCPRHRCVLLISSLRLTHFSTATTLAPKGGVVPGVQGAKALTSAYTTLTQGQKEHEFQQANRQAILENATNDLIEQRHVARTRDIASETLEIIPRLRE